jgi:transcriptional regulator with XRE-family HTH domain
MKLHERVKYYRKINKLSQASLAKASGLSIQVIRSIESGENEEAVLLSDAAHLAQALSTTLDALWHGTEFQTLKDSYDRFRAIKKLPYRDQLALTTVMDHFLDNVMGKGNWKISDKPLKSKSLRKK